MGVIAALFLVLWAVLLHYALNAYIPSGMKDMADYMMTVMGLQFSSMLITLLTVMLSSGAIAADLDTGLAHGVLSRPIRRSDFVFGKLAGLALITTVFATVFYIMLLVIGALFRLSTITALSAWQVFGGWLLYLTGPLAILCLVLWGSVWFRTVPNGILMIFIYMLGNIGGMVEMVGQMLNNLAANSAGIFLSLVSPFHMLYVTFENFLLPSANLIQNSARFAGGLTGAGAAPSGWFYVYTVVYVAVFLVLALRGFSKKDIS